jgi:hypothetical protein
LQALLSRWNVIPGFLIELTTEVAALSQLLVRLFLCPDQLAYFIS